MTKKINYFEGACGHKAVKGRHQAIFIFIFFEGACDHMAL
jgi:hypothetical protein